MLGQANFLAWAGPGQLWQGQAGLGWPEQGIFLHGSANGTWLITPGVKNPKLVFVFLQQTWKQNAYTQNPYLFDTFDIEGDNSARLATCRL